MAEKSIVDNKFYLYLTEFFAGMAVMAVELGASRLLAPYFSSSQIVWTIIIGTIMIAMALGNMWGGRMADKNPDPGRLYRRLLVAAVWIAAIPVVGMKEKDLTGMYYDYALAAPVLADAGHKKEMKILILGMGSGTYAGQCRKYFPQAVVEGVEIDKKITDLAREFFELPKDIRVTTYDGRAYLHASDEKYDVIMVDAYQDITIPFQMSSAEFFHEVREHLTGDGVMVVNMNMKSQEEGSINEYLSDTIASVFPQVYTVDVEGGTNRELFAFSGESAIGYYKGLFQEKGIRGILEAY